MTDTQLSMPVAVPPAGMDPATHYATFANKLTASWSPAAGLVVWLANEPDIARLHAPVKAAMRFLPSGMVAGDTVVPVHTLVLQTWPTTYMAVKDEIASPMPSEIRMENVDDSAVQGAVQPLFAAIGRSDAAVDAFMAGNGLLRVAAGASIGAAAPATDAPSPAMPNKVRTVIFNGAGIESNPVQFFSAAAEGAGIDKAGHPLLSQLDLTGWVEVMVTDASGVPLTGESYRMYLADGTTRTGTTDTNGRIYETDIPVGGWGLDLSNHPSFTMAVP